MTSVFDNLLLLTDSYKASHHKQYPPKTEYVYSYFESRGGLFKESVFFGLQYIIKRHLEGVVVTEEKIQEAKEVWNLHFGNDAVFNEEGWRYILEKHGGMLPLRIKAVNEGSVVPTKNVLLTVENTDPHCYWLTGWVETLLVQVWYPTTVATNSREFKKVLVKYLNKTADDLDGLPFKLHDFGFRGVSSVETAAIGGASHLVNFSGTDTMAGILFCKKFYGEAIAGFSIPASEHSTITSWGKDSEKEAMRNILEAFPTGLVACVSDSYNLWHAVEKLWGDELKDQVLNRDGTLVIRPDSGDPPKVVMKTLKLLEKCFEVTKNAKGYKMLPKQVRLIQGDGVNLVVMEKILARMEKSGWSADNIAFGSGGSLLQKLHRDTLKCAFKCSSVTVDGSERDVFKDPITDPGKTSKKGRLTLEVDTDKCTLRTIQQGKGNPDSDLLETVFENGKLVREQTLADIRMRANVQVKPE